MQRKVKKTRVKKVPMRRCIACIESRPKAELLRIVATEDGLVRDDTGKAKGRGVYLCPRRECLALAQKKNVFARALRRPVPKEEAARILAEIAGELDEKED